MLQRLWCRNTGAKSRSALAEKLRAVLPLPHDDDLAILAGFANPKMAEMIDEVIESELDGAEEMTEPFRHGPRRVEVENSNYCRRPIVWCPSFEHPLWQPRVFVSFCRRR